MATTRTRSNKAKRSKDSILADAKNLLFVLHPAMQHLSKIDRIEGAPQMMKQAAYGIVRHFTVAAECPEVRLEYIHGMLADYGQLLAAFELSIHFGLFTDRERLQIAQHLERIEEGVSKWRNAARSPMRQEQRMVTEENSVETAVSIIR